MNPAVLRLLNQHLACPRFSDPADAVAHMGAMQAQEYRMMRWAVAMRTRAPSAKAFQEAFDAGRIVRLHLMRGTWQLVAAEDYWPLVDLCGPKAIAVTQGWMAANRIAISGAEAARVRGILARTAAEKGSATKEDFVQALAERDIRMDDHRLSYHIRKAEMTGTLCSGDLLPMKATWALAAAKLPPRERVDRDEALAMLARKYFLSRQPATLEDFAWWSGLGVRDCRRGVELLGNCLRTVTWQGREYYLAEDSRTRGSRKGKCLFLPPYDEYLIAYKSRDIVLSPRHRHRAHSGNGIFRPVIVRDGIVCGNWSPFGKDAKADFFPGVSPSDLREEWARYRRFLTH
jgi:hypothetical protein